MPSGPKPISGFGDGVPAAGDYFVFESVGGVTLKIAFADLQAAIGAGPPGADGSDGVTIPSIDGVDGEDAEPIPGERGPAGAPGANGAAGQNGSSLFVLADSPDEPDEPLMFPGPTGATGAPGAGGSDPFEGSYAPGSFDIADGDYVVMGGKLILNGTEAVTINGDGRLVIV